MTVLLYRDRSFVRFISDRARETMFEITMLNGSPWWGAALPSGRVPRAVG